MEMLEVLHLHHLHYLTNFELRCHYSDNFENIFFATKSAC